MKKYADDYMGIPHITDITGIGFGTIIRRLAVLHRRHRRGRGCPDVFDVGLRYSNGPWGYQEGLLNRFQGAGFFYGLQKAI